MAAMHDQNENERRNVRSNYFALQSRINEYKDEIASLDSPQFMAIINEVDSLHHKAKRPREQVADAGTLLGLANTLLVSVKSHSSGGVTPSSFISSLLNEFGLHGRKGLSESAGISIWKDIGLGVSPIFMGDRGCKTMFGPMETELKQRKVTVRRRHSRPTGHAHLPKQIDGAHEEMKDTDTNVRTMFEILKKKKSVKLENLLLNRKSFAQTIENLFALSFLVKDGRVAIEVDGDGHQIVSPRNAASASSIMSGKVKHHHFVFRFDFSDWKLMTKLVPEGDELMPNREPDQKGPSELEQENTQETLYGTSIKKLNRNRGLVVAGQS